MLIVANWKMNPESLEMAKNKAMEMKKKIKQTNAKIVICPPFIYLHEISNIFLRSRKFFLGAQDLFVGTGAAHTGEVSGEMLKSTGVQYVIVGHSEKRAITDTDEMVHEKILRALENNLKVIICVGEKVRMDNAEYFHEVKDQLMSALNKLPKKSIKNIIIAYEPVWAIGRPEKEAMQGGQIHEMHIFIKRVLKDILKLKEVKIPILYGGSVTKNNAKEIVEHGKIDGLLIGRESLKIENFAELINLLEK